MLIFILKDVYAINNDKTAVYKVSNFNEYLMLLFKDKHLLKNFSDTSQLEWLETNGLGGWSGSSLSGCNTRRYHGLLMAAIHTSGRTNAAGFKTG